MSTLLEIGSYQKEPQCPLYKIDSINTIEIHVQVMAGPDKMYNYDGDYLVAHLEVVSKTGERLLAKDLDLISLDRNELHKLEDLCRKRLKLLATYVYPNVSVNQITLRPGVRFIDPETKEVHVTFFLNRKLPAD
jgi:hypothetical protein